MHIKESGASAAPVGDQADAVDESVTQTDQESKPVSSKDLEHALKDLHKNKSARKALEEERNSLKAQIQALEDAKMAEQGKHKELAEKYLRDLSAEKKAREDLEKSIYSNARYNAVRAAASKLGLRPEAESDLEILDLDEAVQIERTEHGRVIVHDAESYAESLKKTKPHWFAEPTAPKFNSGGGKSSVETPVKLNGKVLFELEQKARRSGDAKDKAAYNEARRKFYGFG